MKKLLLIGLLLTFSTLNSCSFCLYISEPFVSTQYKAKKELIQSILDEPDNIDSLILNSKFYHPKYTEDINLTRRFTKFEIVEEIKKYKEGGYEFVINDKVYSDYCWDNYGNQFHALEHSVGVLWKNKTTGKFRKYGFRIAYIRKGFKWYINYISIHMPLYLLDEIFND